MKKSFLLAPAALLLHQGVTFAVPVAPGGHPAEGHHAAAAQIHEQPDILKYMTKPHTNVIMTEGLHSQKGGVTVLAKDKNADMTHVFHTGKNKNKSMMDMHNYLVNSGVDANKIVHHAVESGRGEYSHEKNFIGHSDPNLKLHNWEENGHKMLKHGVPVNFHVMSSVPTQTVIKSIGDAKTEGGSIGFVHHHSSGAGFRNNADQELKDKNAIGTAVHEHGGHLLLTHRDKSWDEPGSAMTRSSKELKEFNPHDHVASAEKSSTFPHNKAMAIDKIGFAVDGKKHISAIRPERHTGKDSDYPNIFNNIRHSEKKDGDAGLDLKHLEEVWKEPAKDVLERAHNKAKTDKNFSDNVATPEMIVKHRDHISNEKEYFGALHKPGMQLEYLDAHTQGALVEAAHNTKGDPRKGAYFTPVKHEIDADRRVNTVPLDHVDPKVPTHWQLTNANADTAFHNVKEMHQGRHDDLHKKLAQHGGRESKDTASTSGA